VQNKTSLHTFRLTSNAILNHELAPTKELFLRDVKTLSYLLRKLTSQDIPSKLYNLLPKLQPTSFKQTSTRKQFSRMRVCFQYADDTFLHVMPVDEVSDECLRVRYNEPQVNEEFAETCKLLWTHAQLNLLDVRVGEDGVLLPAFIVWNPIT
jgi:hypothetical protein